MSTPVLEARGLSIGYVGGRQAQPLAGGFELTLHDGEFVCLLGPNGIGKSTLLRTLAGLQPPLAGEVRLGGDDLSRLSLGEVARRLSVVLTERVSVGNLSAGALVGLGRHPHTDWTGRLGPADEQVIRDALTAVGATALAARPVNELSDGERQKVMIARALAQEPRVMLLDEPTAFLDLPRRVEIVRLLRRLSRESGRAILMSTHDLELALRSADRLWLFSPERTIAVGTPEDLVLSGVFERAFAAAGVEFDREHGSFRVSEPHAGAIAMRGQGVAGFWTRRALERAGYEVAVTTEAAQVEVSDEDGVLRWTVRQNGEPRECESIEALLEKLRQSVPA